MSNEIVSILLGLGMTGANLIPMLLIARRAKDSTTSASLKLVFGGMVIRIFLSLFAVAIILYALDVVVLPFLLTFVISYFIFLMGEIVYINISFTKKVPSYKKSAIL